jgi:anhydro-N-acetylmuramic acid kinase
MALYLGLMSGTSLDGVDGVLADVTDASAEVHAHEHRPFGPGLRAELRALNRSGADELHRAALAANGVADAYADVAAALLARAGRAPKDIVALGAHGQTVRHRPQAFGGTGYTLQLLNAALLAERCGIDVIADFRSRDVAAGGQGAPLVPAFHARCFGRTDTDVAVLNLGGIANLTLLPAGGPVRGFDCGPANALMDHWAAAQLGTAYDEDGRWASGGRVDDALLAACLAEPFFARPPPKSTGLDLFSADWLAARLRPGTDARDVMATLAELTARSAADALRRHAPATTQLVVCGGGAFNRHLMSRLQALLPGVRVHGSAEAGIPPDQVEALAFAWLAWAFVHRQAGNVAAATGAAGPRVLGALYPAA